MTVTQLEILLCHNILGTFTEIWEYPILLSPPKSLVSSAGSAFTREYDAWKAIEHQMNTITILHLPQKNTP